MIENYSFIQFFQCTPEPVPLSVAAAIELGFSMRRLSLCPSPRLPVHFPRLWGKGVSAADTHIDL